jgi:hypothetical protein
MSEQMSMDEFFPPAEIEPEEIGTFTAMTAFSDTPAFDSSDIMPTLLRLAQGLTAEVQAGDAKPGQWLLPGHDPYESVTVVPLLFSKRREYRDADTNEILCVSDDSRTGEGVPGGSCESCPLSHWVGEGKKRKPPQCVFMYAYVVYVMEAQTPALLLFRKSALSVGRMLNSLVAQHGMRNTVIRLTAKGQQGRQGSYYIPAISPVSTEDAQTALAQVAEKSI